MEKMLANFDVIVAVLHDTCHKSLRLIIISQHKVSNII